MKKLILFAALSLAAGLLSAQTLSFGLGDTELEASLNDLNATAKVDAGGFTAEVTLQWGVPAAQVTAVLTEGLQPAEVYLAASFAQASGQPIAVVVAEYKKDKKSGWGALAKKLGIKPGSAAFKALKEKGKASAAKGHEKGKKK